jgi:dihydroneopterin aldolase
MRCGEKMDRIIAKGLRFAGCHGVLAREKSQPQQFLVDVEIIKDLKKAAIYDSVAFTVNYQEVFQEVKRIVEKETFNLIETLADAIAEQILARFQVDSVEVTVYKPDAPVDGIFDYFAVKIKREKSCS